MSTSKRVVEGRYRNNNNNNNGQSSVSSSLTSLDGSDKPHSAPPASIHKGRISQGSTSNRRVTGGGGGGGLMVLSHGDNDDVKSSTSSVGPSPARGQSAGSGVVSRVRVDVLASRLPAANRRSSGGAGGSGLRESRQSSVAATSVVSSALSLSSVAAMERQLGHPLKLDASGTHIILSKEELSKVRDKETLQFLEQNSSMFVKYYQELAAAEKEVTEAEAEQNGENGESNKVAGGTDHRFKPVDASEIAKHVEALYNEITTFITAIDYEGQSYQLTLDEHGDLRVPLPTTEDGDGDAAENDVANLGDFTEEDVRAFNKEFHFMDEHKEGDDDRDASAASVAYSVSPPPLDVKNPFRSVSPDHDSDTSSVVMGSMAPTEVGDGDAGGEAKPSVSDLRTRLANLSQSLAKADKRLKKKLDMVVKQHSDQKPRYLQATASSSSKPPPEGGAPVLPPSPPPKPSRFTVQHCNGRPTSLAVPAIAVRPQRQTLSEDDERRLEQLLNNEDWDKDAADGTEGNDNNGGSTAAFVVDPVLSKRLESIEAQLEVLQRAREVDTGDDGEPGVCLLIGREGPVVASSRASEVSDSSTARDRNRAAAIDAQPLTAAAAEALQAAQRRKELGSQYMQQVREEKLIRQAMKNVNQKLKALSEENDVLSTPPFSLQQQYDLTKDPQEWEWPACAPKPSDDLLRELLQAARQEERSIGRLRMMAALPGAKPADALALVSLTNEFVPPSRHGDPEATEDGALVPIDVECPPASYFHENLRDRMRAAAASSRAVDSDSYRTYEPLTFESDNPVPLEEVPEEETLTAAD